MKKLYLSKWRKVGVTIKQRRSIYEKLRMKAYIILKKRYKQEYSTILKYLIEKTISDLSIERLKEKEDKEILKELKEKRIK